MRHALAALAIVAVSGSHASAQPCVPSFAAGGPGAQGISDPFSAYGGPMTLFQNKLVVTGAFSIAGPYSTNVVAAFDRATNAWSRLGGGAALGNTNGFGAALTTFTINGTQRLILGGSFAGVIDGGVVVNDTAGIAAWDGTHWSSLAPSWQPATGKSVWTLLDWQPAAGGSHVLLAGGGFAGIGSAAAYGLAMFDGEGWSNVGGPTDAGLSGPFSPAAFASVVYNGTLYVGGRFSAVNNVAAPLVARWSGSAWQRPGTLGAGSTVSDCSALFVFDDGTGAKLYAGGYDMRVGGAATSATAFDGLVWRTVGQNLGGRITCFAAFDDGSGAGRKLYAGMTADANQHYLYRLDGSTWTVVAGGLSTPITGNFPSVFGLLATPAAGSIPPTLYAAGNFQIAIPASNAPSQAPIAAYGIAQYPACGAGACRADFNGDGRLNAQDIFDFLNAWFAQDLRADFNMSGGLSAQDIFDYLAAWFAGCP